MRNFTATLLALSTFAIGSISAQGVSNFNDDMLNYISELSSNAMLLEEDNWSFFNDPEHKVYLIDFETITHNLSEIVVYRDKDNVEVWNESVFDMPVNMIYEIEYKDFPKGYYRVEIRSFRGVLKKYVTID